MTATRATCRTTWTVFSLIERQVGAVFAIDGQTVGIEAFGSPETFGRFFAKLVKSYALDAIDSEKKDETPAVPTDPVRRFIASAAGAKAEPYPSVGLGETRTFSSRIVTGAALVYEKRVLHLSAFRKLGSEDDQRVGFQRFSRRLQSFR